MQGWTADDRLALGRTLRLAGAAIIGVTLLFGIASVLRTASEPGVTRWLPYLVSQSLIVATPIGFTLGLFFGLAGRPVSRRLAAAVLGAAFLCSIGSFATLTWSGFLVAYYHFRWAVSLATFALAMLALSLLRLWQLGALAKGLVAGAAYLAYLALLLVSERATQRGILPPAAAAWLPSVSFAFVSIALPRVWAPK
jgi:hypothetical protein